jgi:hypothetical protein
MSFIRIFRNQDPEPEQEKNNARQSTDEDYFSFPGGPHVYQGE